MCQKHPLAKEKAPSCGFDHTGSGRNPFGGNGPRVRLPVCPTTEAGYRELGLSIRLN